MTTIVTRYESHTGGSNVGWAVAQARGVRRRVRIDQALSSQANHTAAAVKLAAVLGLTLDVHSAEARHRPGYRFHAH